jgi:hypothetical protein
MGCKFRGAPFARQAQPGPYDNSGFTLLFLLQTGHRRDKPDSFQDIGGVEYVRRFLERRLRLARDTSNALKRGPFSGLVSERTMPGQGWHGRCSKGRRAVREGQ